VIAAALDFACRVFPAMSSASVLAFADSLAPIWHAFDGRGRVVGHQNLKAIFPSMSRRERRRILMGVYRNALRTEALLFHLQPMTPARYARWVRMEPEDEARFRGWAEEGRRGVLLSAHFGNWELLIAARVGLSFSPSFAYLVETTRIRPLDHVLDRLRSRGAGGAALRKRGSVALMRALEQGKCVSFIVDRNIPSWHGGRYVPFLGLPARTTPLGSMLARRFDVPLGVALMIPDGPKRWRLWISGNLRVPPSGDDDADALAEMTRVNDLLGEQVLAHPEAWLWTLKRWKGRPTDEQGRYPDYSLPDPY
jgi:KDO2-lipid IV(A) lauroyltransferase